jgi:hypothetical protein
VSVHVTMRTEGETPVLTLSGVADEALLRRLAHGVEALAADAGDLVVIDVDDLLVTDGEGVRAFLAALADGMVSDRLAFVCQRLSCRRLLRRFGGSALRISATAREAVDGRTPVPA